MLICIVRMGKASRGPLILCRLWKSTVFLFSGFFCVVSTQCLMYVCILVSMRNKEGMDVENEEVNEEKGKVETNARKVVTQQDRILISRAISPLPVRACRGDWISRDAGKLLTKIVLQWSETKCLQEMNLKIIV